MAERLPSFDFDKTSKRHEGYPWEEWQDGSPWLILQDQDFSVDLKSMQSQLYLRGKATNMQVRAQIQTDPNRPGIVFQFFPDRPREPATSAATGNNGNGDESE